MTWLEGFLITGLVLAILTPAIDKIAKKLSGVVLALYPLVGFIYGLNQIGKPFLAASKTPWLPENNIYISFGLDSLGLVFWLIITGIGTLIFLYASGYMKEKLAKLLGWLLAFMVAMLAVVSAQDLISLFIAWELTSITSFMLIGFNSDNPISRKSATQALVITGTGGLILFAGLILLGIENNSFAFASLQSASPLAIALVTIGCFTKSAQFPFHFWLPNAMAAPTPVSAYLHSATMVKAGVFLLAKFSFLFGAQTVTATFGAITLIIGSILSLTEKDLKRILAWSTVAALGSMVMLIGINTKAAAEALIITILAHACYKGALFMIAGNIDLHTGTRDITKLHDLNKSAPAIALGARLAALSFAGIPVFLGFIKKESQLTATLSEPIFLGAIIIAGICSVAAAIAIAYRPFTKKENPESLQNNSLHPLTSVGPFVLGGLGLFLSFMLLPLGEMLVAPAASQVAHQSVTNHLKLFHGFNTEFLISLSAITMGCILGVALPKVQSKAFILQESINFSVESIFQSLFQSFRKLGHFLHQLTDRASFRQQLLGYFLTFVALVAYVVVLKPFFINVELTPDIRLNEAFVCVFAVVAALGVILSRKRMGGVAILGITGVAITLTYVTFGAPDLALTQLLIEVLSVVLFVLVFSHLPALNVASTRLNKVRDAAVAILFGTTMCALVLGVLSVPKPQEISAYYGKNAYVDAHGKNVVNVIIVDYRALDTLGEITVLCVAALGVHSLIRFRPVKKQKASKGGKT